MKDKKGAASFAAGVRDGMPIAIGYFAVSFTLGIQARSAGLSVWEAAFMSLTNLTSAGQFAA
ncbi:MAG: AzlC family ABC transporter permease, partial [Lachnospiraceae bacterium]|nr:AzlC family ABC transporter permease [Lachnospiraceae bacterium]